MNGTAVSSAAAIDPSLPHLESALDSVEVGRRFQRSWPREGPAPSIIQCTRQHVRWSPGSGCVATYRLRLSPVAGVTAFTIGAVSVTADGVRHWLYADDGALSGLGMATDAAVMAAWFADRVGQPVPACSVNVVRYRPETRCVLRYDLPERAEVFFGKVLSGDRHSVSASVITALGEGIVAPLLGHAKEWQLIVQRDAGSESLASLTLDEASTSQALHESGALVARLHAHPCPDGEVHTIVEDARKLSTYIPLVERCCPAAAGAFAEGVDLLRDQGGAAPRAVPSHGALRLDQVRIGDGAPLLIDLDAYCRAAPERDAGNLLAYLRWRQVRGAAGVSGVERATAALLSGYASGGGASLDRATLRAFEAASLLKIAGRRCRSLETDNWQYLPALIDSALGQLRAA